MSEPEYYKHMSELEYQMTRFYNILNNIPDDNSQIADLKNALIILADAVLEISNNK
jgi:hypothetical protein